MHKLNMNKSIFLTLSTVYLGFISIGFSQGEITRKKFLQHIKVVGNQKCIECHENEIKAWKSSKHYKNKDLHTVPKASEIAKRMGINNPALVRTSPLCTQCHFTVQKLGNSPAKAISGVSCESCHGGATDWLDVHNTGDRREKNDTQSALVKRENKSTALGMLYPKLFHKVAENCFSCHIITDEKLVNVGGHPASSLDFELASWVAGEVRHNFFLDSSKNAPTPKNRRRMFYITGLLLDMEYSLLGLSRAKEKKDYGKSMGRRCGSRRKKIDKLVEVLGAKCPEELKNIHKALHRPGLLKFFNVKPLKEVADVIKVELQKFVKKYNGSEFPAVDSLIPNTNKGSHYNP